MVRQIAINGYDKNFSYFIVESNENLTAIVDPGDIEFLDSEIEKSGLVPKIVLVTHSHFDHTEGVAYFVKKYDTAVYMHRNARGRLNISYEKVVLVDDNDVIKLGEFLIKVLYTPGHIDDAVCYYIDEVGSDDGVGKLITGDTVFVEACGRADLPNSNMDDLYRSLQRIKTLPDKTKIYPGHDYGSKPVSTIGWEKEHNKYFLCGSFEEFKVLRLG